MKNFHQSLICLDLRFIQVPEDVGSLYSTVFGFDPSVDVQNFIFEIKFSGVKRIYFSEVGDVMFIDWGGRSWEKNHLCRAIHRLSTKEASSHAHSRASHLYVGFS
jgi:hypothetical protein